MPFNRFSILCDATPNNQVVKGKQDAERLMILIKERNKKSI